MQTLPKPVISNINKIAHREALRREASLKAALVTRLQKARESGSSIDEINDFLSRAMASEIVDLQVSAATASMSMLAQFAREDAEAGALATELIQAGIAKLEMTTTLEANESATHRLVLRHVDDEGEPVEIAVIGCKPIVPTKEALAARIWFFGQLSHWQKKH